MANTKVNPNKGALPKKDGTESVSKRHNALNAICEQLAGESRQFQAKDTYEAIGKYIDDYGRWFYSDISNFLFVAEDETVGSFLSNLETLQSYAYSIAKPGKTGDKGDTLVVMIDKLWDHSNLAQRQKVAFSAKEKDIDDRLELKLVPRIDALEKTLTKEFISLIAIFTALSFVIFGGISSLDNIFEGARSFPILQVLIIGCVWGLCILNLVFIFTFFISKLTHLSIASTQKNNAKIAQKFPFWVYSNLLFVFLLAIFGWLYLVDYSNSGSWLIWFMQAHPKCASVGGLVVIVVLFSIIFLTINKKPKEEDHQ